MTHSDSVTRRLIYHGRVHGVGFRITARRVASRYSVGGSVRNFADGTVELIACGAAAEVDRYLSALAEAMSGCISGFDEVEPIDVAEPSRFEIRY